MRSRAKDLTCKFAILVLVNHGLYGSCRSLGGDISNEAILKVLI